MGKRSSFERIPRDFYPTPVEAVLPLLPHVLPDTRFIEPCAGKGDLFRHLQLFGRRCIGAADIEPLDEGIEKLDASRANLQDYFVALDEPLINPDDLRVDAFITNPPWDRKILHPIIENLSRQLPTWLLFDADWVHTRQSAPYLPLLRKIVSVGRVKWIKDSSFTGKDNCAWHLFDAQSNSPAVFVGREAA